MARRTAARDDSLLIEFRNRFEASFIFATSVVFATRPPIGVRTSFYTSGCSKIETIQTVVYAVEDGVSVSYLRLIQHIAALRAGLNAAIRGR